MAGDVYAEYPVIEQRLAELNAVIDEALEAVRESERRDPMSLIGMAIGSVLIDVQTRPGLEFLLGLTLVRLFEAEAVRG